MSSSTGSTQPGHRFKVVARVRSGGRDAWTVEVEDPASPLAGLAAIGTTLVAARDALAQSVAVALAAGELDGYLSGQGLDRSYFTAVRVYVTTARTYRLASLTSGVA